MFYPAAMGALTQLWAGTTDEGLNMNGKVGQNSHPRVSRLNASTVPCSLGKVWQGESSR
jgi:hypothetical protein